MARRDTAAMAAASWPDANVQFRRGRRWFDPPDMHERKHDSGRSCTFSSNDLGKHADHIEAARHAQLWANAERLFAPSRP
jgi:hypothetical protein